MATVMITGGTGMIGTALTKSLLEKGYHLIVITRGKEIKHPGPGNIEYVNWDIEKQEIDKAAIAKADFIIHLAGAGVADRRWTKKRKQEIVNSRVKGGELLETPNFYHYLSGQKNLQIAVAIKERGKEDIPRVLEKVNLFQRKDSKFSTYSLGMKQRLAIASTLLGDPDILVFDEPTNGLDPAGIAEIRELMKELNRQGKTIIMASHILDEVEKVCTHVAIIQKGVLKTVGSVGEVLNATHEDKIATIEIELAADNLDALESVLRQMPGVIHVFSNDQSVSLECDAMVTPTAVNKFCSEKGVILGQLTLKRKSLEKRFLEITGGKSDR